MTRQLLAFSRKQLLEPRIFDLNDTITAIARLLSRLLGADIHVADAPLRRQRSPCSAIPGRSSRR